MNDLSKRRILADRCLSDICQGQRGPGPERQALPRPHEKSGLLPGPEVGGGLCFRAIHPRKGPCRRVVGGGPHRVLPGTRRDPPILYKKIFNPSFFRKTVLSKIRSWEQAAYFIRVI